jgi:cytochrome c551/c552
MKAYLISISAVLLIVFAVKAQTTTIGRNEALAKKSGCFKCHGNNDSSIKNTIGPSFRDIAARYKKDSLSVAASMETLIEKVKKGGKGNWTEITHGVPMPPYSRRLSDKEIRDLIDWIFFGETEK